jgi:hypothetical protein
VLYCTVLYCTVLRVVFIGLAFKFLTCLVKAHSFAQGNARMTQCNAKMTQGIDKMTQGESEGPRQGKPGNYTVLVVFPTPPRGLLLGLGRKESVIST